MTFEEITESLHANGVRLDPKNEQFQDRNGCRLEIGEVLALLPGATEEEVASWSKGWAKALRELYYFPNS